MSIESPFWLFETMRWEDGGIALWPLHLARLGRSAAALGIPTDLGAVERAVEAGTAGLDAGVVHVVRLRVDEAGTPTVTSAPFKGEPVRSAILWGGGQVDPNDPVVRHKTTRRALYARALAYARVFGHDEAILINARWEVTEGAFTNVWIERDGRLLTPPVAQTGGLPGVMRAHLLATRPEAEEALLKPRDLYTAESVYLSNALRGFFPIPPPRL